MDLPPAPIGRRCPYESAKNVYVEVAVDNGHIYVLDVAVDQYAVARVAVPEAFKARDGFAKGWIDSFSVDSLKLPL